MFEIFSGASYLFQWDLNQKLIVHDDRVVKVHFSNSVLDKAIVRECYQFEGKLVCDIPNKLLETSGRAYVYPFAELDVVTCTLQRGALTILEKKKPNDYVEDDDDVYQWTELEKRIRELEKGNSDLSNYYTKEVAVQNNQPTSSTLWIDTDSTDEINLAEIDDNTVSDEKTWSSTKISREIVNHENNTTTHVTSAEKQVWNNKVDASQLPTITQEAGESETLIMSQKAVTQLVNDALAESEKVEYEEVDSVDQMTDKTKQYVLKSTGTIWSYTSKQELVEHNAYDPNTSKFNTRIGSSGGESTTNGIVLTDYIEVEYMTPYNVTIKGISQFETVYSNVIVVNYYDSAKTRLGAINGNLFGFVSGDNGQVVVSPLTFDLFNPSTYKNAKFVRIQVGIKNGTSISASTCNGLVINLEPKNTYQEVATWVDTEMTPQNATTNYVDLLTKINQNTSDISELEMQLANISSGSESLTIPTFWENAVNEVITKIKALQVGRNCITFPFFSDNHQRNGYVGLLSAYIMKECNIPYCFFGGDSISSGYIDSEATMIAQDKAFDTIMSYIPNGRFCRAVGNHDGYWAVSSSEKHTYTRNQVYELFLREESIAQNKHFGDDGTYYYVDDLASKVRFIVLNTNGGSVDSTQISWLQNTALSLSESGWGVVFISHQPISNHYHANISNAQEVRTIVKNYINGTSTNKADVIGWFSGHIHRDRIYTGIATNTTDDTQGTAMGFTQVTITSDHTSIAYDDSTKHTVANDDKSHAIDFVTINKSTRQVNITRLGIGNDRSYTY